MYLQCVNLELAQSTMREDRAVINLCRYGYLVLAPWVELMQMLHNANVIYTNPKVTAH